MTPWVKSQIQRPETPRHRTKIYLHRRRKQRRSRWRNKKHTVNINYIQCDISLYFCLPWLNSATHSFIRHVIPSLWMLIIWTHFIIYKKLGRIYNQDASIVSMTATLYLLMHPLFTFPASYLIIGYGNAMSIRLGALLTLSGVCIRCLI